MALNRELDASSKERVGNPSADFTEFVSSYFTDTMVWGRGEHDPRVLDRLQGFERDTASAMILANLHTGHSHIIHAAARLKIADAVPVLQSMWRSPEYDQYERIVIAKALHRFGAVDDGHLLSFMAEVLQGCGEFAAVDILTSCYVIFAVNEAQRLVNIGIRRPDYSIRCSAYDAAVAIQFIRSHGGTWNDAFAEQIWIKKRDSVTVGSEQPMWYPQAQYYIGDRTFADKTLFEQRLAELWEPDPKKRRVPLFTEINVGRL